MIVVLLGLLSFGLNVLGVTEIPTETFFMPHTRFWELLAGSALAYVQFFKQKRFSDWMKHRVFHPVLFRQPLLSTQQTVVLDDLLSALGLLLLAVAVLFINKSKPFPGWWALLPVFGALLLILAGPKAWVNRVVLSNRWLVFIGVISYPLYLWHWPILSFAQILESKVPSWEIRMGAVALSSGLAWVTYRLIEKPIRFGKGSWGKIAGLIIGLAVVGYAGYNEFQLKELEFRTRQFVNITRAASEWGYPGKLRDGDLNGIPYRYQNSDRKSVTLFIGDSNIEQYFPRVEALIASDPKGTNGIVFKTGGRCLPVPNAPHAAEFKYCPPLMSGALRIAKEKPEIDTVVIGAQWTSYLQDGTSMTKKFGAGSPEYQDALNGLGGYIKELRALNKRVFLVLSIPMGPEFDPKYMVKRDLWEFPKILSIRANGLRRDYVDTVYGQVQADLVHVATRSGARVIRPIDSLCTPDCAGVDADGEAIYKDAGHLRPGYARKRADFIDVTVR
jgi:hypothetical protein